MAWDGVKYDYIKTKEGDAQVSEVVLFHLFCIFNRFCDPLKLPMILSGKALNYIFHELEIRSSLSSWKDSFDLMQFFIIMKNFIINEEMIAKIERLHVKIVKNILIEGRYRYRITQNGGSSLLSWKSFTGRDRSNQNCLKAFL